MTSNIIDLDEKTHEVFNSTNMVNIFINLTAKFVFPSFCRIHSSLDISRIPMGCVGENKLFLDVHPSLPTAWFNLAALTPCCVHEPLMMLHHEEYLLHAVLFLVNKHTNSLPFNLHLTDSWAEFNIKMNVPSHLWDRSRVSRARELKSWKVLLQLLRPDAACYNWRLFLKVCSCPEGRYAWMSSACVFV